MSAKLQINPEKSYIFSPISSVKEFFFSLKLLSFWTEPPIFVGNEKPQ